MGAGGGGSEWKGGGGSEGRWQRNGGRSLGVEGKAWGWVGPHSCSGVATVLLVPEEEVFG